MAGLPLGRRTLLKSGVLGAGAAVMLARHGRANADKPRYGGRLRVAYHLQPGALDPLLGRSGGDAYYWRQFVDQLVDADAQLNPRARTSLAESWDISDPRRLVLTLRRGVRFHDGTGFDAAAVAWNIERLLDPAMRATPRAAFGAVESVEALDEHVVRFNLRRPWVSALGMLADRGGAMNSPSAVRARGADYAFRPVSTGPFKVADHVAGSHVRFMRNGDYWGRDEAGNPLPYLDEIVISAVPDQAVQVMALRAGELDLIYLPHREVVGFERSGNYAVRSHEGGSVAFLMAFNRALPPMDNPYLRLAVAHAVNPDLINRAFHFGRAVPAQGGMWPPGSWAHDPSVARPVYDVARAHEYLARGGRPGGFEWRP